MNEPTTLPEVIAYLTAKFTAGTTQISASAHDQTPEQATQEDAGTTLSQTQILHLLELGLANPSKQEDKR